MIFSEGLFAGCGELFPRKGERGGKTLLAGDRWKTGLHQLRIAKPQRPYVVAERLKNRGCLHAAAASEAVAVDDAIKHLNSILEVL